MAEQLREAVQERGQVGEEDGEIAMAEVVTGVRDLAQNGLIYYINRITKVRFPSSRQDPRFSRIEAYTLKY